VEKMIFQRLEAMRAYQRNPVRDPHMSLDEIFRLYEKRRHRVLMPTIGLMRQKLERFRRQQKEGV